MEEKATEETVGKRMTEERVDKFQEIITCIIIFLTIFLLCSGWFLPTAFQIKNVNVRIPDYIWLSSAAFHVIITTIWTSLTIVVFQNKDSSREWKAVAFGFLSILGLCLTSFVSLFTWFRLDL